MKPSLPKTPRSERTLDYYFSQIMDAVVKTYLLCEPGLDEDTFKSRIFDPLQKINVSGDSILRHYSEAGGTKLLKGEATLLACIYCIQSKWAQTDGCDELAWSYIMDAQKHISIAITEDVSEPQLARILDFVRTEAKSTAAKKSVAVSVQPWRAVRSEAFRLIDEKAQRGQRWEDVDKAALEILDELRDFLKKHPGKKSKNFWSNTPEKTVSGWLREMPDAKFLFGNLR
jgi:hypothetical protein